MNSTSKKITLIGAGLNGPLLAILLMKRGFAVEIYERRPDMRRVHMSAGRSINLATLDAWNSRAAASRAVGADAKHHDSDEGQDDAFDCRRVTFQPYGKNDAEVINSISRAELNIALMNAAEEQGATIHFHRRCTEYDLKSGEIRLRDENTGEEITRQTEVMIGCDGAASALRAAMLKLSRFNFSQQYLDYGYKELTIPAGPNGEHLLETNALHIWPRGNHMLIALPNIDGTFACILFLAVRRCG